MKLKVCPLPARLCGSKAFLLAATLASLAVIVLTAAAPVEKNVEPQNAAFEKLEMEFARDARPLLAKYCFKCHTGKDAEAELDFDHFKTMADIRKSVKSWQKALEMLDSGQMPPKKATLHPTADERAALRKWVYSYLSAEALLSAGDPGRVVLRRLSNAEYTYTIRDLTGAELSPAREFPVDSAAGEGFTNTGSSLVMSPALLTKYLDAGKGIAAHAVLLPDGIRFSSKSTRRDWTEELLGEIRGLYGQYTQTGAGIAVNLQGIKFNTRDAGVAPIEKYIAALIAERDGGANPQAIKSGLSPKYLGILREALNGKTPSLLLDPIRMHFRNAKLADAPAISKEIAQWQTALWKFNSVGHIGKAGGPKGWEEAISPLQARQELRIKVPASPDGKEITLYLAASDAGDGNDGDFVVWEKPRLVAPGRPDLLLRDVRDLPARRQQVFALTKNCLRAAAEASATPGKADVAALAKKHGITAEVLAGWLDYLGIGSGLLRVEGHFTTTLKRSSGFDFINGWGSNETPLLVANSSDQHVRIPGNMRPHSVAVHPSPKLAAVVGWRSPVAANVRVEAMIQHAHPECGNGVTWSVELRRGGSRQRLSAGVSQGSKEVKPEPTQNLSVQPGDLISLLIGPRDGNHSCDLTAVDLVVTAAGDGARQWSLWKDVSPDILSANPHADRFGNEGVWHFYTEPDKGGVPGPVIPAGSLLAKWQSATDAAEKGRLAEAVQKLLISGPPAAKDAPDAVLYRQLASLGGPLLSGLLRDNSKAPAPALRDNNAPFGLDPAQFGKHPDGSAIDASSLCVRAPAVTAIRLPADLVEGSEFVTTGSLHAATGKEGSVQLQVMTAKPTGPLGLVAGGAVVQGGKGTWTDGELPAIYTSPIVVNDNSAARKRIEASFDEFRRLFPAALCYTKIVPVDEVVTLTLYYREDHHFIRLMLDDAQTAKLERLWDELHYVSHDALTLVDAFEQLWQFATQDADPRVFEPMREPIKQRAAAFRQRLVDTQPAHLEAVLRFAENAYRRPLTDAERGELRGLYRKLRDQELPHDEAIRFTIARVLVAPAFLYRAEKPGPATEQVPISDWELASRLSYFLWSSMPDNELRAAAVSGKLRDPEVLASQTRRMLRDPRARRLATEFACHWIHIQGIDELDEKSERHFPTFVALRGAMYEESVLFFTDLFAGDGSVLDVLDADYTFLNEDLARHYGIPGVTGPQWRKVTGIRKYARGGILGQASTLAKQSGASRTSPILRGNWVSEVLLGEKLPRPPKDVPRLPEDETATEGLTVRQLVEKHSSDPRCATCHVKVDPLGFSLEAFDAIGRHRAKDLAGRPIDTRVKTMDGVEFDGMDGLRSYLLNQRRDSFLRQFCRKLLGYSLGRSVQLSDEPLLVEMQEKLKANGYKISVAFDAIVQSRQFREIRGKNAQVEE